ncbi:MAG: hypothetical protein LBB48_08335 [Treponema sp.]|jgi:hypothetical protein|nr:hypothetical protein [Treponema sp.]
MTTKQFRLIVDAVEENAEEGKPWPHIQAADKTALKAAYDDWASQTRGRGDPGPHQDGRGGAGGRP